MPNSDEVSHSFHVVHTSLRNYLNKKRSPKIKWLLACEPFIRRFRHYSFPAGSPRRAFKILSSGNNVFGLLTMKASTTASKIHARAEVESLALKAFLVWSSCGYCCGSCIWCFER